MSESDELDSSTGDEFPRPSALFANRYRIEALLGSGGMARVYRAQDLILQRAVEVSIRLKLHSRRIPAWQRSL
jgi:serine/threonine protein kinase